MANYRVSRRSRRIVANYAAHVRHRVRNSANIRAGYRSGPTMWRGRAYRGGTYGHPGPLHRGRRYGYRNNWIVRR